MKRARSSALNWAFVATLVMVAIYAISFFFGGMPPLTIGGYEIETSIADVQGNTLSLTMPMISGHVLVVIVPLLVFSCRYLYQILVDAPDSDDDVISACVLFSVSMGVSMGFVGEVSFMKYFFVPFFATVIVVFLYLLILSFYLLKRNSRGEVNVTLGAVVCLMMIHSCRLLIHVIFYSSYRLEWLLFLPGIVLALFLASIMLVSIIPCIIACFERFCVVVNMLIHGKCNPDGLMG